MTNGTTNGRGLAALIPTSSRIRVEMGRPKPQDSAAPTVVIDDGPALIEGLELVSVEPLEVTPNPRQPRGQFDQDSLVELAQSLKEVGFLQPIVVRRAPVDSAHNYELVAGERRWRAAQLAGFASIPALVRTTEDNELLREALLENLQRVALNPLEEAAAYEQLLADFGGTHIELAQRLGRSRPSVSNTLRLLKLPAPVQKRVAAGVLSAGHARALLGLDDLAHMELLAKRVVAEGISVRGLEEIVAVSSTAKTDRHAKSRRRAGADLPELAAVSDRLADRLDTRVSISMGRAKGKISIEFGDVEDLHRIITLLGGPAVLTLGTAS